jgi:hypothetical protein
MSAGGAEMAVLNEVEGDEEHRQYNTDTAQAYDLGGDAVGELTPVHGG